MSSQLAQTFPRSPTIQNESFFLKEFYNTFIEKVINAFDSNGEINQYWHSVKQKMKEEKSFQQLYRYMLNLDVKKRESSKLELYDCSKCTSMKTLSIPTLPYKSLSVKDEEISFNQLTKKTPTNVRTVLIQFDAFSNKNNQSATESYQLDSPSLLNAPLTTAQPPPPLQIQKNSSSNTLKSVLDSPQLVSSPLSANLSSTNYNQGGGSGYAAKSTFKILENIRKRNSLPSSPIGPTNTLAILKSLSSQPDQNYLTKQLSSPGNTVELPLEKKGNDAINLNKSNSNDENNNFSPKAPLKRFSPQQIMRMGSIREAEDEVIEESESIPNKEVVKKLLDVVVASNNAFKLDTETIMLIHGKFSLVTAENCKNSIGHEFLKNNSPSLKPTATVTGQITSENSSKFNQKQKHHGLNIVTLLDPETIGRLSGQHNQRKSPTKLENKYFPK